MHTDAQRAIREVGTSVYAFEAGPSVRRWPRCRNDNYQGEYYLTDVIGKLVEAGHRVEALIAAAIEGEGVNSHDQLAGAAAELRRRINHGLMHEGGVWMQDPERTYVDADVRVEPGAQLVRRHPFGGGDHDRGWRRGRPLDLRARFSDRRQGLVSGTRCCAKPMSAARAEVGPYVQPATGGDARSSAPRRARSSRSRTPKWEKGRRCPTCAYVGDATIGKGSNVGAGTITVNYDGYQKHRTVIGDGVKIGSDTMLVAPVVIGDDAWTGAGSVITKDIPPGALGVARSPQKEVPGYAAATEELGRSRSTRDGDLGPQAADAVLGFCQRGPCPRGCQHPRLDARRG